MTTRRKNPPMGPRAAETMNAIAAALVGNMAARLFFNAFAPAPPPPPLPSEPWFASEERDAR